MAYGVDRYSEPYAAPQYRGVTGEYEEEDMGKLKDFIIDCEEKLIDEGFQPHEARAEIEAYMACLPVTESAKQVIEKLYKTRNPPSARRE